MKIQIAVLLLRFLVIGGLALSWVPTAPAQTAAEQEAAPPGAEAEVDAEVSEFVQQLEALGWERSGEGDLGEWATVDIPAGHRFTASKGAQGFMEMTGNLAGGGELGIIAPEEFDWWALFEFNESGYVKDEDKDEIDAEKMLKTMRESQEEANKYRKKQGLTALEIVGWAREPYYNEETNNLEWATKLRNEDGGENVNFNTRLLGRRGVMEVTLICDEAQLPEILQDFQSMIDGFDYKKGQSYAEFKEGDKIAKYGLAALIIGGGAALAAKAGLFAIIGKFFAKFAKLIIAGVIAIGLGIKRLFSGRSEA